jgi:hypothetical protein
MRLRGFHYGRIIIFLIFIYPLIFQGMHHLLHHHPVPSEPCCHNCHDQIPDFHESCLVCDYEMAMFIQATHDRFPAGKMVFEKLRPVRPVMAINGFIGSDISLRAPPTVVIL